MISLSSSNENRYKRLVTFAGYASTCTAIILICIKAFAWLYSGSSTIFASLVDSALDLCASGLNLLAIKYSILPKDDDHKYGHGKAESLAGLLQAAFICGSAIFVIMHGISRVVNVSPIEHVSTSIVITIISVVLTIILVSFQTYVVKKTKSNAVLSDLLHYKSDVILNISVLLSLGFMSFNIFIMDGIFTIGIGIYILISAIHIAKLSTDILLDHNLPEKEEEEIIDLAISVPGITSIHDLRTRKAGATYFIQMHLDLDSKMSLQEAHDITEKIEEAIESKYSPADIIIHMEPIEVEKQE